jgi:DNA-binding SARP family transcriptional activator/TolB-like protein
VESSVGGEKTLLTAQCGDTDRDSRLEIRLLGTVEVIRRGRRQPLPASRKTRALLAYLALAPRPCARENLCDLLWNDVIDPRGELRWSLSKLRAVLGPWLVVSGDGVGIAREGLTVDAVAFRRLAPMLLADQEPKEPLPPWRGDPLANAGIPQSHRFHSWWTAEREALMELHVQVLRHGIDRLWCSPREALAAARDLVARYPLDEWGHGRVAQALRRVGRGTEARDYVDATRRALSLELGLPRAAFMTSLPAEPRRPESVAAPGRQPSRLARTRALLGVLPLQVVPDDRSLDAIAARFKAELVHGLWRSRVCDVADCEQGSDAASRDAGLTYAVRGTLTRLDGRVRLSLRCVNAQRGDVLWFMQLGPDDISAGHPAGWVGRSVGAIHSSIQVAEMRRAQRGGGADDGPGDLLLAARAFANALEPAANRRALEILAEALDRDPRDPRALALTAWCHAQRCVYNWAEDGDRDRGEAERLARAAALGGGDDPDCLTIIGSARSLVADHGGAGLLLGRALQLDPYSSLARARSGWTANYLDRPDLAIRHFRAALRLAPHDPASFNSFIGLGVAHFIKGDNVGAIGHMERGLALNPRAIWAYRNLVPAYIAAGRQADGERGVGMLLTEHPALSIPAVHGAMVFSGPVMARISEGLARAGLSFA